MPVLWSPVQLELGGRTSYLSYLRAVCKGRFPALGHAQEFISGAGTHGVILVSLGNHAMFGRALSLAQLPFLHMRKLMKAALLVLGCSFMLLSQPEQCSQCATV